MYSTTVRTRGNSRKLKCLTFLHFCNFQGKPHFSKRQNNSFTVINGQRSQSRHSTQHTPTVTGKVHSHLSSFNCCFLACCPRKLIIKVFVKRKILSLETIVTAHTRTHTKAPAHTSILTIQTKYAQLKTGIFAYVLYCDVKLAFLLADYNYMRLNLALER